MKAMQRRILSLLLAFSLILPMGAFTASAEEAQDPRDGGPVGNDLVVMGLFDIKSLEAGTSKYLYVTTFPEEGTSFTAVSSDPSVVDVSVDNNSSRDLMDDKSGDNSNYNYIKLDAKTKGDSTVTVTATDDSGVLPQKVETFTVQVIDPEYAGTQRTVTDISQGWKFKLERDMVTKPEVGTVPNADESWANVSVPHCWNDKDGADGGNNYHKGVGWYEHTMTFDTANYDGRQVYLDVGAACKVSEVYVNGTKLARHEGGYSRFRVDLTKAVTLDQENTIAISIDNRVNGLTPMSGDFTVFGGLYRDISIITTGDTHMNLDQTTTYGGNGLYVSQNGVQNVTKTTTVEQIFGEGGKLNVKGQVKNSSAEAKTVSATTTIYDADWKQVAQKSLDSVSVPAGEVHDFAADLTVPKNGLRLWNGTKDPYQYNVVFEVKDNIGTVVDREQDRIGFRFYCADSEKGFFLNGESYPLRGVNSHQDRYGKGNAATHQDREQDMAMIAEMGANTIRFAHYQHDPLVYELAAERGITVWAEIPMVNSIVNTRAFYNSTVNNLNELIHQAYNCPSVLMWGIHNEQWPNNQGITVLLDLLYKTAKAADPSRYVTVATAQDPGDNVVDEKWDPIALSWQSDVSAWNKYFGIYQGQDVRYFGNWINQVHEYGAKHKEITGTENALTNPEGVKETIPVYVHGNVGMAEYGADCSINIHEEKPGYNAGSQSEEFTSQWHEIYYKTIDESEWMWGSYIWNMFEFGSDGRTTTPDRLGINTKGIVSYDRTVKKDAFYFYQSNWSAEPSLHINSSRFENRLQDDINVKVYSNLDTVELFVDGVSQGKLEADGNSTPALNNNGESDDSLVPNTQLGKFEWAVNMAGQGEHKVIAVGTKGDKTYTETATWNRALYDVPGISSSKYSINDADPANRTISKIPGNATMEEVRGNINMLRNSTLKFYTAEDMLIDDETAHAALGMKLKVTSEDGLTDYTYTIVAAPISQGKAVGAGHTQTTQSVPVSNVVDGNPDTRWGSGGSFPEWFVIDLGQPYTINNFKSLWFDSAGRTYEFEVYGSLDGSLSNDQGSYKLLMPNQSSNQGATAPAWTMQTVSEDFVARYIKIVISGHQGSPSIYEFQVNGLALQSNVYAVDNAARVVADVDKGTTVATLLEHLAVEGAYDAVVVKDSEGNPAGGEAEAAPGMTVVVTYSGDKTIAYAIERSGPSEAPVSRGKPATALPMEGTEIPNEDAGDGCGKSGNKKDTNVAGNINDGNLTTRWSGALLTGSHTVPENGFPADVVIDLGNEYVLNQLDITLFDGNTPSNPSKVNRYYKFAVYAGNSDNPAALKTEENKVWDVLQNGSEAQKVVVGQKSVATSARYILLDVIGSSTNGAYHAGSAWEFGAYGYRFASDAYRVDTQARTISGVTAGTRVDDFLKQLNIKGNYTAEVALGEHGTALPDDSLVTEGTVLRMSTLKGQTPVAYAIEFVCATEIPVSQGMPVSVSTITVGGQNIPNEDANDGCGTGKDHDVAVNINDGHDNTRWTGALLGAGHIAPGDAYPGSVTIALTKPNVSTDTYHLTGVKIHFFEGSNNRAFGYNITAKNPVGIETGFDVNASDNATPGWVEHWSATGLDEIKDMTLTVEKCTPASQYATPAVYEMQIYAWRIKSVNFDINETAKIITIGSAPITVAELRNGLDVQGNCTVRFIDDSGTELALTDTVTVGSKLLVTDVRNHTFPYAIVPAPEVTAVIVAPDTATVQKGNTQQFTAQVEGTGDYDKTVTWSVEPAVTTSIDKNGLLTVAADETATTLTVTATSTFDGTKFDTATVTLTDEEVTKHTLTVTGGSGSGDYAEGTQVFISAGAPEEGKRFKQWEIKRGEATLADANAATTTLTMPAAAVEVEATYGVVCTLTLDAVGGVVDPATLEVMMGEPATLPIPTRSGSYRFDGWYAEDGTQYTNETIITGDVLLTARWTYTGGSSDSDSSDDSWGKTVTKKNPDGSTTTTETKPNGDKTETVKHPDGSVKKTETKKDGTVTETITQKDGYKRETVTNPDGSSTSRVTTAEGLKAESKQDADGNLKADVTLPENAGKPVILPVEPAPVGKSEITVKTKGPAKVIIPVENPTATTVVVIVKEDGTEEIVKDAILTKDGLVLNVDGTVTVKLIDNAKEFSDLADAPWAAEAVAFVTSRELFNGVGEGLFDPNATTSRAMFFTVLSRLEGVDTTSGENWYSKAMAWSVEAGISDGNEPDAAITREQLVTMLYRYAGEPETEGEIKTFSDSGSVSDWAKKAMDWAVGAGILTGKDGDRLDPTGTASRVEVAVMLQRFMTR